LKKAETIDEDEEEYESEEEEEETKWTTWLRD
jgi:hypothetical protein